MIINNLWCDGNSDLPVDSVRDLFSNPYALRTERNNLLVVFIDKTTLIERAYIFDTKSIAKTGITDEEIRTIINKLLYKDKVKGPYGSNFLFNE
jgi:hypothetical protein